MEDKLFLVLNPEAVLTEADGCVGLCLDGKTCFAQNTAQAAVLRALARQPQPLATVSALLWARDGPLPAETETALATASFILDFGEYFSTDGG